MNDCLFFSRNLRKVPQKIFINSCFSMLFLVITFLIGIKRTNQPRVCHAVSVLLHYFTLTTFGWMSVECLSMYRNVFRLYQGSRFFWTMCVSTWGNFDFLSSCSKRFHIFLFFSFIIFQFYFVFLLFIVIYTPLIFELFII